MGSPTYGRIEEFDSQKEEWAQYVERFGQFFIANSVEDAGKKRAILLTVMGPKTYKLLRSLVHPAVPGDKSYDELVKALTSHFKPTLSEIVQRFCFNMRFRKSGESIAEYVSELRALTEYCNFGDTLETMLQDRLVCGINDGKIQNRLLSETDLTHQKALSVAQSLETAAQNLKVLQRRAPFAGEESGPAGKIGDKQSGIFKVGRGPGPRPKYCKARSVPYALRDKVEAELQHLVKEGVLEPIEHADWASPIVAVLKSDKNNVRICGDFKQTVNPVSKLDRYPIPKVEDLFAKLAGGQRFTKLDLSQAYQQMPLDEESKQYVVINTHKGLFRYTRLPYGISSAPGIFQRVMENLLDGILGVVVYFDDILITGQDDKEHLQALNEVLRRLEQASLIVKKSKCNFMVQSVQYLGHQIDANGLHPLQEKVRTIEEAPAPRNTQELRSYLGLLTYYSKFLPNMSTVLAPVYRLLKKDAKWSWGKKEAEAFEASKELLSSELLIHFNPHLKIVLACDASSYGVGAVLAHQMPDGTERPIGYASRSLSAAEKNYSQLEREGLACVFGVKHFHAYLFGHQFHLVTDHKSHPRRQNNVASSIFTTACSTGHSRSKTKL